MTFNIVALTTSLAELTQSLLRNSYSPLWLGSWLSVASNTGNTLDVQVIVLHLPLVIHLLVLTCIYMYFWKHKVTKRFTLEKYHMWRYKYFTYGISQKIWIVNIFSYVFIYSIFITYKVKYFKCLFILFFQKLNILIFFKSISTNQSKNDLQYKSCHFSSGFQEVFQSFIWILATFLLLFLLFFSSNHSGIKGHLKDVWAFKI